jgi:nucleotide-binding universal stress UspA family protein
METVKTVMVAIGFSDYCGGVFDYAAQLAEKLDADLLVASIINSRDVEAVGKVASMGYEVDGEHYVETIRKERLKLLEEYLQAAGFPAERVRTVIQVGNPLDELLKITVTEDVQMLVMGVKGRSDLEHIFIGSIAEKLFRRSPVTIVSYRDEKSARRLQKRIHV